MALDGDERLIVSLEARVRDFERNFAKAKGTANRDFGAIEKRAKQSADRMEASLGSIGAKAGANLKNLAASFAGGFAVGGIAEIVKGLGRMVTGIAEVGDAAKRSGLSTDAFQEWKFVAEQNRIGVDALTDGFKELNLRADEFVTTGGGSAADAFKRLGFTADQLKTKLKDPSALMLEIIGRLQTFDKAAQIRISDELFGGTGGEQFVQLIAQGEAGLRQTIDRAHELGAVMDADLIARAAELDRQLGELSTRAGNIFKIAIVDLARMVGLIREANEAAPYDSKQTASIIGPDVSSQLDTLPQVSEGSRAEIQSVGIEYDYLAQSARDSVAALSEASNMMNGLGNTGAATALTDLASRMEEAVQQFEDGTSSGADLQAKLTDIATEAGTTISAMSELDASRLANVTLSVGGLLDAISQVPAMVAQAATAIRALEGLSIPGAAGPGPSFEKGGRNPQPSFAPVASPRPRSAPAMLGEPDVPVVTNTGSGRGVSAGGGGGGGGAPQEDAYQRQTDGIRERIAALQVETEARRTATGSIEEQDQAVEQAKLAFDLLNAAQEAGKAVTPELTAEANALAKSMIEAEAAARQLADAQKAVADRQAEVKSAGKSAFVGVVTGATTALEALQQLVGKLAEMAASDLFDQLFSGASGGTGGGLFGGLLKGLLSFDGGGYTGEGARSGGMDGKGGFLAMMHPNETVLDHAKSGMVPAFQTGGVSANTTTNYAPNVSVSIQGSGNPAQDARLAKMVAKEVGKHVNTDTFRRTKTQSDARAGMDIDRATRKNG